MTSTPNPNTNRPNIHRPDPDPIGSAMRAARRHRRWREDAACALCGETNPVILTSKPNKHLLEKHHVAGRDNDEELVVVLCLNCHTKLSAGQHDVGVFTATPAPTALERLILAMKSLGLFCEALAEACYRWAEQLAQTVSTLDQYIPQWRTLPGMP